MFEKRLNEVDILVVDFETTGLDPSKDKIIEAGWNWLEAGNVGVPWSELFSPGDVPISPQAKAVSHITEDMVEGKKTADVWITKMLNMPEVLYAAHNAAFDQAMAGKEGWLCTMKLAKKLWPEAPAYGNEVLRYWRNIELYYSDIQTHRAGHDAHVTACLLQHIISLIPNLTVEAAFLLMNEPNDLSDRKVGFGKHADLYWRHVPWEYLLWISRQDEDKWDPDVWFTVQKLLDDYN